MRKEKSPKRGKSPKRKSPKRKSASPKRKKSPKRKSPSRGKSPSRCPAGYIRRKAYTRVVNGKKVHVKASCIPAQSYTGVKRRDTNTKYWKEKEKQHKAVAKKLGKGPKCPKGTIPREGYVRKGYTNSRGVTVKKTMVKAGCTKDVTGRGKKRSLSPAQKIGPLRKGDLSKYGYSSVKRLTASQRHMALDKALKEYPPVTMVRKLGALANLNVNKDQAISKIFRSDQKYVMKYE